MRKKIREFSYRLLGYNVLKPLIILDCTVVLLIGMSTLARCYDFNCKSVFDFFILSIGGDAIHNKIISLSKISWLIIFILNAYYFGIYLEQEVSSRINLVLIRYKNARKYINYNLKFIVTITSIHFLLIYSILFLLSKNFSTNSQLQSEILKNVVLSDKNIYDPNTLIYMILFYILSGILFCLIQLFLTLKFNSVKTATLIISVYYILMAINPIENSILYKFAIGNSAIITRTYLFCTHIHGESLQWLLFYNILLILIFYCLCINTIRKKKTICINK